MRSFLAFFSWSFELHRHTNAYNIAVLIMLLGPHACHDYDRGLLWLQSLFEFHLILASTLSICCMTAHYRMRGWMSLKITPWIEEL